MPARGRHAREGRGPPPKSLVDALVHNPPEAALLDAARALGVSRKRFLGWEPTQTHRGYDAEGNRVPLAEAWEILVTTEPEWDDEQRNWMLALAERDQGICACGHHRDIATDPANYFTPAEHLCPVCAARAQQDRVQAKADKDAERAAGDNPQAKRPSDGRYTYMRMLTPAEVTQAKAASSQRPSVRPRRPSRSPQS